MEFVPPDCPLQDFDEWPVRFWTIQEAAAGLRYVALMCANDAKDAYYLSVFAGCTGELLSEAGFALQPDGSFIETS